MPHNAVFLPIWAAKAGAVGPAGGLGAKPGQSSGNYSFHFDNYTSAGIDSVDFYELPIARRFKNDLARVWGPIPFIPPHEVLLEELESDPQVVETFEKAAMEDKCSADLE